MGPERVRQAHRAQPFKPFIIHMGDGRQVSVEHPEFMAVSPTVHYATIYKEDESTEEIELFLVTSLEFPAKSNGSRKKK
jgi:hypothetical protein